MGALEGGQHGRQASRQAAMLKKGDKGAGCCRRCCGTDAVVASGRTTGVDAKYCALWALRGRRVPQYVLRTVGAAGRCGTCRTRPMLKRGPWRQSLPNMEKLQG